MAAGMKGKLTVTVHKARGLKDTNLVAKLDPYVQLWTDGEKFKTKTHENGGTTPSWEQSFIFNLEGKEDSVHFHVWDKETLSDDSVGRADLNLKTGIKYNVQEWYQLVDKDNFSKKTGEVLLTFTFTGTGGPSAPTTTATATPTPTPVVQQPVQQQQPVMQQPMQSFGQPMQMGYPGQPMMQPMYAPQQPQVVYVQQPVQQPQVVYVQAPVSAPVAVSRGWVPLEGQSGGTQGLFIQVSGHKNLRVMDDGSVNAHGAEGPLAKWTAYKQSNGTLQLRRDNHIFRIHPTTTDAKGAEKGPHTYVTIVPHGSGYTFKSATNGYLALDGSGNAVQKEVMDINQAAVLTFKAR